MKGVKISANMFIPLNWSSSAFGLQDKQLIMKKRTRTTREHMIHSQSRVSVMWICCGCSWEPCTSPLWHWPPEGFETGGAEGAHGSPRCSLRTSFGDVLSFMLSLKCLGVNILPKTRKSTFKWKKDLFHHPETMIKQNAPTLLRRHKNINSYDGPQTYGGGNGHEKRREDPHT